MHVGPSVKPEGAVTVVCGSGRCGSTMIMAMLEAGGVPVVSTCGVFGYYEDIRVISDPIHAGFIEECRGKAVKVLRPSDHRLPLQFLYRFVWMNRDPDAQARSMWKFMGRLTGVEIPPDEITLRLLAEDIAEQRALFVEQIREYRGSCLDMQYESVVADPLKAATALAAHIGQRLDVSAMARAVLDPDALRAATDSAWNGLQRKRK